MNVKEIFLGTFWYGIIPKLSTLLYIVVLPLTTPYLTILDFGMIGVLSSYTAIFGSISSLGLHIHLPNSYYELKNNYILLWKRIAFYFFIIGFFLALSLSVILYLLLKDTKPYSKLFVILITVLPIVFIASQQIPSNYYILTKQPRVLVIKNLISSLLNIITFYICARVLKIGYISWLMSSLVSSVTNFLLFIPSFWYKNNLFPYFDFSLKRIKKLLKISLPVIPHSLGHTLLASSDRIILSIFKIDISKIGFYSTGLQISNHIKSLVDGFNTAINPFLQVAYRAKDISEIRKLFFFSQLTISITIFIFSLWMKEIFYFLIRNNELRSSYLIASLICFSFVNQPFYAFLSLPIFIKKKTEHILWLVFFPGILSIILNIIFIPIYGYLTVVIVSLLSYWTIFIIPFFFFFYKNEAKIILNKLSNIIFIILCNFILLLFILIFSDIYILLKILITVIFSISYFIIIKIKLYH
jgi:O-antigen/teichoic acid export membrane protein